MTVPKLKHRDVEWVERARRDSSNSLNGSPPRRPSKTGYLSSRAWTGTALQQLLLSTVTSMGSDNGHPKPADKESMLCSDVTCQKFFIWKLKLLHTFMAAVLTYVGLQQLERHDAAVWLAIFLVPAIITILSTIKIQFVDGLWVRSLVSVYLGSSMCFMLWLATNLLIGMVEQSKTPYPNYNPLDYQNGREVMAVAVCIGWQKFHLITSKEQMKVTYSNKEFNLVSGVSAKEMMKRLVPLLLLPTALGAFCYIESVRPLVASTTHAIKSAVM